MLYQRKEVLRAERNIRRLGGRSIFTRRACSIKYNKYADSDDKFSNNAETERKELQNKSSIKKNKFTKGTLAHHKSKSSIIKKGKSRRSREWKTLY